MSRAAAELACADVETALVAYHAVTALDPSDPVSAAQIVSLCLYDAQFTPGDRLRIALDWAARYAPPADPKLLPRRSDGKLRISYVSMTFGQLPARVLLRPLLEFHDPDLFIVYAYTATATDLEIAASNVNWRYYGNLTYPELARAIRADAIDVLVNLDGAWDVTGLLAFALRPAPIQISSPMYPSTTGLRTFDARLSFPDIDSQTDHTEPLLEFRSPPLTYTPDPFTPPVATQPPVQRNGRFTFGSFNNPLKLNPVTFQRWGQILTRVPSARLLLHYPGMEGAMADRFRSTLKSRGVPAERVECVGALSPWDHLDLYGDIDLLLDTWPYNGSTTTLESLWMGCPVLTLKSPGLLSANSALCQRLLGLDPWAAASPDEYIEKAVHAASGHLEPAVPRAALRERMRSSPLMDGSGWVQSLEQAYLHLSHVKND